MDSAFVNPGDRELAEGDCLSKRVVREVKPEDVLLLSVKKSEISESCSQTLFLRYISGLNRRIPKQIMTLDEKYIRQCLELIHLSAFRSASWNIPSKMAHFSDSFSSRLISSRSLCGDTFAIASGTEGLLMRPTGNSILLESPLFHQFGVLDNEVTFGRTSLFDVRESAVTSSSGGVFISSSQKLQKERAVLEDRNFEFDPEHKRVVSVSSTNSTTSDQSSSTSNAYHQGMLHCSWNNGFPHYVFSVDDHREIYIANSGKVESSGFDFVYMFHSRGGKKKNDLHEKESDLVGKMTVSTSITICPNNSKILETQFILCGTSDNFLGEMQTSNHTLRKHKGLSKKVVDIFRAGHSYRQRRTTSKLGGTSAIQENSVEPWKDSVSNLEPEPKTILSENNLELAAIIIKTPVCENLKEAEIGGWGMKFLKKDGNRQTETSPDASDPSCRPVTGNCSTSMDVLVPAGFHGGPRTRNGSPSSLIERWKSGGHCDCGGWDIGCPLTVLNTRSSNNEVFPQVDVLGASNTFDLFIQGSKEDSSPTVKMVNIHDGLYYIHYHSTFSALQSLSIAVAFIHSRNPTLQSQNV